MCWLAVVGRAEAALEINVKHASVAVANAQNDLKCLPTIRAKS
jgi:hypothetical protein